MKLLRKSIPDDTEFFFFEKSLGWFAVVAGFLTTAPPCFRDSPYKLSPRSVAAISDATRADPPRIAARYELPPAVCGRRIDAATLSATDLAVVEEVCALPLRMSTPDFSLATPCGIEWIIPYPGGGCCSCSVSSNQDPRLAGPLSATLCTSPCAAYASSSKRYSFLSFSLLRSLFIKIIA